MIDVYTKDFPGRILSQDKRSCLVVIKREDQLIEADLLLSSVKDNKNGILSFTEIGISSLNTVGKIFEV